MEEDKVNLVVEGTSVTVSKRLLCENSNYFKTMFGGHFREEKQRDIELHLVTLDTFQLILDTLKENDFQKIMNSKLEQVFDVFKSSNMFQFEGIQTFCTNLLSERIQLSNCWTILSAADFLSEQNLVRKCENIILFSINETTTSDGFLCTSEECLLRILNNPHLNISDENHLQKALEKWCVLNIEESSRQEKLGQLKMAAFSHNKFLPVVPCVVGYTYENDEKKARIFCWDKVSQKIQLLDGEMDFEKFNYVETKGFKIASSGPDLVMSGGEYSFGNSNWQKGVMLWSSFDQNWRSFAKLELSRRHHSAVIINKEAFLIGGFGKHRVILDSVVRVNLETGEQRDCANIPVPMYRPAVAAISDNEILLVGKQMVAVFNIRDNIWRQVTVTNFPKNIEYDNGMYNPESSTFYLTSRISRELHKLRFSDRDKCDISLVGSFSSEAQNTCFIAHEGVIYNFNSDEFGDERMVETFNAAKNTFEVAWKELVTEDFSPMTYDFSPHYSLGCFPLVNYDFRTS